jgi:hypothetical protein
MAHKECYSNAENDPAERQQMMSYRSKKELLEAIRPRYLKATRKEKSTSWTNLSLLGLSP